MIGKIDKNENRLVRHKRVRKNLSGTSKRPRLCAKSMLKLLTTQRV